MCEGPEPPLIQEMTYGGVCNVYDGIAGESYTPEDDLIPMDPYRP